MGIKIFLDDIRIPIACMQYMGNRIGREAEIYGKPGWTIVRNMEEFVKAMQIDTENITHVSFDHDLADEHYAPQEEWGNYNEWASIKQFKEKTGLDCAKWMLKYYDENNLTLPVILVHSMNPSGTENIKNIFKI